MLEAICPVSLSQSFRFLSEFQRNIASQSYPLVIISSLMLGYSFISRRFHTKHDIPIRCSAGNTIQSLESAKSEISNFLFKNKKSEVSI